MFKYVLMLFLISQNLQAQILDALSALSSTGTAINSIGRGVKGLSDTTEALDAGSELYGELNPESSLNHRASALSERIEKLSNLMIESGYTAEEVNEYIGDEAKSVSGLTATIRHVTRGIRIAKKIGKIGKELKGHNDSSNEELLLNELILSGKENQLSETEKKIQEDIKSRKMLLETRKHRRSLQGLPENGIANEYEIFPIKKYLFKHALSVVTKITPFLISSIFLVLITRTALLLLGLGSSQDYGALLKDSLLCGFVLLAYPLMIEMVMQFSDRIANATKVEKLVGAHETTYASLTNISPTNKLNKVLSTFNIPDMSSLLYVALSSIKEFIFFFGIAGFVVALSVIIALGPLFIFISTMFGLNIGSQLILVSILILSLFPAIWNLVGTLGSIAYDAKAPTLPKIITEIVIIFAQFFAPFKVVQKLTGLTSIPSTFARSSIKLIPTKLITTKSIPKKAPA